MLIKSKPFEALYWPYGSPSLDEKACKSEMRAFAKKDVFVQFLGLKTHI